MRALTKIQIAIRKQRYQISSHANEEMSEDNFISDDVENIINTGEIMRRYTRILVVLVMKLREIHKMVVEDV